MSARGVRCRSWQPAVVAFAASDSSGDGRGVGKPATRTCTAPHSLYERTGKPQSAVSRWPSGVIGSSSWWALCKMSLTKATHFRTASCRAALAMPTAPELARRRRSSDAVSAVPASAAASVSSCAILTAEGCRVFELLLSPPLVNTKASPIGARAVVDTDAASIAAMASANSRSCAM